MFFSSSRCFFFFFNDTPTTEIYTLSLHDALPISARRGPLGHGARRVATAVVDRDRQVRVRGGLAPDRLAPGDRKSTRLNSSHSSISYAVFCLNKKKNKT